MNVVKLRRNFDYEYRTRRKEGRKGRGREEVVAYSKGIQGTLIDKDGVLSTLEGKEFPGSGGDPHPTPSFSPFFACKAYFPFYAYRPAPFCRRTPTLQQNVG